MDINQTAITTPCVSPAGNTLDIMRSSLEGLAYAANLLFGFPIHSYILWLILRGGQRKIASDFIPLNQIVVEILLSLSGILYFLNRYMSLPLIEILYRLLSAMFLLKRPLVQSFICLEQYLATVHPVIFFRCKPLKCKVVCFCVSWLTVVMIVCVGADFNLDLSFLAAMGVLYLILLLLMAFCCFSVLRTLKRPGPGAGQRGKNTSNTMKKRAFNLILFNLVYTTVSQLPIAIMACLGHVIPPPLFKALGSVNIFVFIITGFVPSILYLYRVRKLNSKCKCI